eukprot:2753299-Rhodomonas_salina.3
MPYVGNAALCLFNLLTPRHTVPAALSLASGCSAPLTPHSCPTFLALAPTAGVKQRINRRGHPRPVCALHRDAIGSAVRVEVCCTQG